MSTNYYLPDPHDDACPDVHQCLVSRHIGKRSAGWEFVFQGDAIHSSRKDWEADIERHGSVVVDEYGTMLSSREFWEMVDATRGHGNKNPLIHGAYYHRSTNSTLFLDGEGWRIEMAPFH